MSDAEWASLDMGIWRPNAGFGQSHAGRLPSYSNTAEFGGANPSCAICKRQKRGAKKCACPVPDWRVKGQPVLPGDRTLAIKALQGYGKWCDGWVAECFRVLIPGGRLISFGGTRTFHRLTRAAEKAGFRGIRQGGWVRQDGSMPRGLNIGLAVAEVGDTTGSYDGYYTTLKPAWEPFILATKERPVTG